jgi:hypothetical protein
MASRVWLPETFPAMFPAALRGMSPDTDKTRETRLRRMAERRGLRLQKSPRRDTGAWDFGTYQLADAREGWVVAEQMAGQGYGMSLDDVEEWLNEKAVQMYKVTAVMLPRSFPAVTAQQRQRFTDAIGELSSRKILTPVVEWSDDDQARVTLASGGQNSTAAAERAREIIDRNAANMAHIYVHDITVLQVEFLENWSA